MATRRKPQSVYQYEPLVTPSSWKGEERQFVVRLTQLLDQLFARKTTSSVTADASGMVVTTMTSEAFEALTTDEKAALFASGVRVIAVDGDLDPDGMTDMQRFAAFLNPVGSIVHFDIPTSPATLWGFGTWEAVAAGRVLVGAGTADSGTVYTAGQTGGEETHTLIESELPKIYGEVAIHGGENGSNYWSPSGVFANSPVIDEKYKTISSVIKSASSLSHFVFDAGGDQPHNNMQPYYVCYIWRRIA